jgi:hypothetical protein
MKPNRFLTLLIGLVLGAAYAFLSMFIVTSQHSNISISYIFVLPLVLGAFPVLFSTKQQLRSYLAILLLPWICVLSAFYLAMLQGFEGLICLVIIVGPFLILGSLGAFIFRLIRLKNENNKTPLYCVFLLPFLLLAIETHFKATDQFNTVSSTIAVNADQAKIWENIKNVKNIQPSEIGRHFIHMMGIPKPLDGRLNKDGVGGVRSITWEKGIKFREIIDQWNEGSGFSSAIKVDPKSIPPTTLDEHVMIGGKYFDVIKGGYRIVPLNAKQNIIELTCTYRITSNLNFYGKWWADFILNDFNNMILEVIKNRCEAN